jgi:hypothetical protein
LNFIRSMEIKKAKYILTDDGYTLNDDWFIISLFFMIQK